MTSTLHPLLRRGRTRTPAERLELVRRALAQAPPASVKSVPSGLDPR